MVEILKFLPYAVILLALVRDILSAVGVPGSLEAAWLAICGPFRNFLHLKDLEDPINAPSMPSVAKARTLSMLAMIQAAAWLGLSVYAISTGDDFVISLLSFVSWFYLAARCFYKAPSAPPYTLMIYAIIEVSLTLVNGTTNLANRGINAESLIFPALAVAVPLMFIWIAGTIPLQCVMPATNVAEANDIPSHHLSSPEDSVTLWSWCTLTFVEPLLKLASTRTIHESDVWTLSPYFLHKNLFNKYLKYRESYPTNTLLRFLLSSNSLDLILDILLELWSAFVGFVPPYALKQILSALSEATPQSRSTAYFWTMITLFAHLSFAQVDMFQRFHTRRAYERTRGQLFCCLHYKALVRQDVSGKVTQEESGLDGEESSTADLGKIVNLMQGDAYSVAQRFWEFSALFAAPVRLTIALVFLYRILGWSALSGVLVILFTFVLNYPLARYNVHVTRESWKAKDSRMNTVNELLQNIRFLKLYGWENSWAEKARIAREDELDWRIKENTVDTALTFIWTWMPSATALVSFMCYTMIAKERLTVAKAFTSIALFSQLQGPMVALPGQLFAMLHAYVSMQRIEQYLNEEEIPEWASTLKKGPPPVDPEMVRFEDASFEWYGTPKSPEGGNKFRLGPLNIPFPHGELTLVTGATGSGKSALLVALLGEMRILTGSVTLDKSNHQVAYCAQNPWLEHATIRDNIIFGSTAGYDETRYNEILDACGLRRDLEVFEYGDLTEIGEKGITMSGGQRARIALARAFYSQAQVILLDDPLAAIDMHTSAHVVEHCLSGKLARGRTIILVTHHITLTAPVASHIIELSGGTVLRQGSVHNSGLLQAVVKAEEKEFVDEEEPELCLPHVELASEELVTGRPRNPSGTVGKLIQDEARAEGRVSWRTYWTYVQAAGIFSWVFTVILMFSLRAIDILNQVYLSRWGEAYSKAHTYTSTALHIPVPWEGLPHPDVDVVPWMRLYLYISLSGAITVLLYIALGYYASLQASRSLFVSLLKRLTRAPARFFDITPVGRLLNRFTSDINTVDGALQNSARAALSGTLNFIASFSVIMFVVPTFAPFALFIAWLYIRLAPPYIKASRDLRRLESISLSPTFAGFDELLRGLAHVRAFGMESRYQDSFYKKVDKFQSYDHVYWLVSGWLSWRYDCLGSVVVFFATIFALRQGVSDGAAAIVIVQAGIFAEASRQLVRVLAQLELDFNSVERIIEYLDVAQEAPAIIEKSRPPAYWPSSGGELVLEGLTVKYAPELPEVLKDLSLTIRSMEKIGVVGRTGSGKSTLAMSLLRMVEATSGRIILDGVDIAALGLEDLRSKITIVSQDVSLFSGTVRSNLDPHGEHTDLECLDVLERCHLLSRLNRNGGGRDGTLDLPISQGGSLSAGERQLLALARAFLRRSQVVILDESTAQIDSNLDDQIQTMIRDELAGAIVITIAHRLKTVLHADRVLVMDGGRVAELGSPRELLEKEKGAFRAMCKTSADWESLSAMISSL